MNTLRVAIIIVGLLAMLSSCGEKRTTADKAKEQEEPGVGMGLDSANQKLDSTIKAADTASRRP